MRMKFWLGFGALVLVCYAGLQWQLGRLHAARDPAGLSGDTCAGKKSCVGVYLAPWCPHCKEALPYVQMILQKSRVGDTGVRVMVGMEREPGTNDKYALQVAGKDVVVDRDLSLAKKYDVQGVPAFFVMDAEGAKVVDGPEATAWVMEKFGR